MEEMSDLLPTEYYSTDVQKANTTKKGEYLTTKVIFQDLSSQRTIPFINAFGHTVRVADLTERLWCSSAVMVEIGQWKNNLNDIKAASRISN